MKKEICARLSEKQQAVWKMAQPLLERGRPGDDIHAEETVEMVLDYRGTIAFDPEVVILSAMMHDIGHAAILPEHFVYITGKKKIKNGKLVHMLSGAKIAKDIMEAVGYDSGKTAEVVGLISMHDADQLDFDDPQSLYDTDSKRFFHDIDILDRYSPERIAKVIGEIYDRDGILKVLEESLESFFFKEFQSTAVKRLEKLKRELSDQG